MNTMTGRHSDMLVRTWRTTRRHIPAEGNLKQNTVPMCNLLSALIKGVGIDVHERRYRPENVYVL
jgi:hypothetical protein